MEFPMRMAPSPHWRAPCLASIAAVVIGKTCKNVSKADALSYVAGYTCANDVSARDWQRDWGGSQWCRGKGFDTFCPLGPYLVTPDEIPNPNALQIKTLVNNEVLQ